MSDSAPVVRCWTEDGIDNSVGQEYPRECSTAAKWMLMEIRRQRAPLWPFLEAYGEHGATGTNGGGSTDSSEKLTVPLEGRSTVTIVNALASAPLELDRLVHGKSDEQLWQPAQDGGSGMVEILPHLRDWETILADRVDRILTADVPTLEDYDDSLWSIEHDYRNQDPRAALAEFSEKRGQLVSRLRELNADDWNRAGTLAKHGRVTLHWMLDRFCDHDAKHLMQARDVLA